mmetsp:Transcript_79682/g.204968  ORF Transcript_79682/g.204968 Transcript_79682/m.204968 type:complete len:277 (+) Transcript_79682:665-1495(+)
MKCQKTKEATKTTEATTPYTGSFPPAMPHVAAGGMFVRRRTETTSTMVIAAVRIASAAFLVTQTTMPATTAPMVPKASGPARPKEATFTPITGFFVAWFSKTIMLAQSPTVTEEVSASSCGILLPYRRITSPMMPAITCPASVCSDKSCMLDCQISSHVPLASKPCSFTACVFTGSAFFWNMCFPPPCFLNWLTFSLTRPMSFKALSVCVGASSSPSSGNSGAGFASSSSASSAAVASKANPTNTAAGSRQRDRSVGWRRRPILSGGNTPPGLRGR